MATSEGFKDFVLECLERANAEFGAKFSFSSRKTIPLCAAANSKKRKD